MSPLQLARYLNRNYWEKKQEEARKSPTPSAPVPLTEPAAQPAEGHAAPASVAEVRGPPAPVHGPPGGAVGPGQCRSPSGLPQTPLLETDSQPTTSPSGPFSEVSGGSIRSRGEQSARPHTGACPDRGVWPHAQ